MKTTLEPELESDPYLISLVRGGDVDAYGRLYERHVAAARRLARVLSRDHSDADDLVAETFTKVLAALRAGRGPDTAFRAYLFTAMRHTLYDRGRRDRRVEYTDDLTPYERLDTGDDPVVTTLERSYAARAFARLPERWRTVLWHTAVEGETPAQIAPMLGLTPNGVAALAHRARERLRQMYLQEHIEVTDSPRCHWTGTRLAGYVRASLARRDRTKVEDHLAECVQCRVLHRELTEENNGLRGVLAGLLLGSAAPGYLAAPARTGGGLAAAIGAILAMWWHAVAQWCADLAALTAGLVLRLYRLPRRLVERYGPGNVAAAGGLVAAGLVGVIAFAAVLVNAEPQPPGSALRPPEQVPQPVVVPPTSHVPPTPTATAPAPTTAATGTPPDHADAPVTATIARPAIMHDPAEAQLTASEKGVLPIAIRLAESSVQADSLHLGVPLPAGLTLAGSDAGDGWTCGGSENVRCERALPVPAGRTVARIPIAVPPGVSGYHSFPVTVSSGAMSTDGTIRAPIAPAGLHVGYAATGSLSYALGGNVLIACRPRPACLARDNNGQEMLPKLPDHREPMAPPGLFDAGGPTGPDGQIAALAGEKAASGARITVPGGARVQWAGLQISASGGTGAGVAAVHTPGGGWYPVALTARGSGHATADLTDLVRREGGGDWWVAVPAVGLPTGPGQYAGWSLVVVYRTDNAPSAEVAVYLGPKRLHTSEQVSVRLGPAGTVDLGLVVWDGDRDLADDTLTLDGAPLVANAAAGANESSLLCAVSGGECVWRTPGLDVLRHKGAGARGGWVSLSAGNDPMAVGLLIVVAQTSGPGAAGRNVR